MIPVRIHLSVTAVLKGPALEARRKQIEEILDRGNMVVFTCGDLVKKIDRWQEDGSPNDLKACHTNGQVLSVCWMATAYKVSEEITLSA